MAEKEQIVKELRQKALSANGKRKLERSQKAAEETIKYLKEAGRVDPEKMKQVFTI
jgi:hypothetical protein